MRVAERGWPGAILWTKRHWQMVKDQWAIQASDGCVLAYSRPPQRRIRHSGV